MSLKLIESHGVDSIETRSILFCPDVSVNSITTFENEALQTYPYPTLMKITKLFRYIIRMRGVKHITIDPPIDFRHPTNYLKI